MKFHHRYESIKPEKPANKNLHEIALIASIKQGNETALKRLYHLYYPRIFRFVSRIAGGGDFIDDVINEVMYVVWENAEKYNQRSQVSTWIFGIAYNKTLQFLRRSNRFHHESLEDLESDNAQFGKIDHAMQEVDFINWLEAAFKHLSPQQRAVVELTFFHGMHYKEIAQLMTCSENTVKTRMFHARKKMIKIYQQAEQQTGETD